jgi:hypothetical protein
MYYTEFDYKILSFLNNGAVQATFYIIMNDVNNQDENFLVLQSDKLDTKYKIKLFGWINTKRFTLNEFIYFAQNNNLTIQIADKDSTILKTLLIIMKAFWTKYHVFIIGLISSVCLTLSEFTTGKEIDWMVVGYAVFVGVGSYFAKNLKGQGATIAGILLTTGANTYTVLHDGGQVNVSQLLMTVAVSVGLALAHASSTPATTVDVKPVEPTVTPTV